MALNNGFQDKLIENVINQVLNKHIVNNGTNEIDEAKRVIIPHCMTYGPSFQDESDAVRKIVKRGVEPVESHGPISLRIYCRPNLTASLVMKNNNTPRPALENETNVVYRFECTVGACRGRSIDYIGLTTTSLRKRMESHRYNGAIHTHFKKAHERKPTTKELLENSSILHLVPNYLRLAITEAVSIELRKPKLNVQREFDLVLPSCRKRDRETNMTQDVAPLPNVPIPNANTTVAPLPPPPPEEEGAEGAEGHAEVRGTEQQVEAPTTEYVRQRLRPRTLQGTRL